METIRFANSDVEILACWDVVSTLRPHLSFEGFLRLMKELMRDGYQLIFIEAEGKPVSFAGFSEVHSLIGGKCLYIHDLCTLPGYRNRGFASQLLDYIHKEAKRLRKNAVHLDSGYDLSTAHRLYLNKGYKILAHHFGKSIQL